MTTEHWTIVGTGITAFIVCGALWRMGVRNLIKEKRVRELLYEARWWDKHTTVVFEEAMIACADGRDDIFQLKLKQHELCLKRFRQIKNEIEKLTA